MQEPAADDTTAAAASIRREEPFRLACEPLRDVARTTATPASLLSLIGAGSRAGLIAAGERDVGGHEDALMH